MTSVRQTTGDAYRDGSGAVLPVTVNLRPGDSITDDQQVQADACVIGTGAGGAVVAKELAEHGLNVVMIEAGDYFTTDDMTARPREMLGMLYRDAGQSVTLGNVPIGLPQGEAVGGTTLINSGTCFRAPASVLDSWQSENGLEIDQPTLDPFFRRVERELNVSQVPPELAGRNALIVKSAADALGWSGDFIFRNARGCVGSGVCAFGCPTSAKQHTAITYVAKAWNAGAVTYTGCRARRVLVSRGRAQGVEASTTGGGRLTVLSDIVVVAAGTIQTPVLLERQGLASQSGQLGRNLTIHPSTAVLGLMDEQVDMATGVPQSYYIDEFSDRGIIFEGIAGPPDLLASTLPLSGDRHREVMLQYGKVSQFGVMVSESSRGRVRALPGGQTVVGYNLRKDDVNRLGFGLESLVRLYTEAGARRIFLPVRQLPEVKPGDYDALRRVDLRAADLKLMAFHPLGTARAHADPAAGVVDGDLRVHQTEGLYIADGSVVPTPLGVNPQITIMALAARLAYHLTGQPAPDHEPEPEKIAQPKSKESVVCHS